MVAPAGKVVAPKASGGPKWVLFWCFQNLGVQLFFAFMLMKPQKKAPAGKVVAPPYCVLNEWGHFLYFFGPAGPAGASTFLQVVAPKKQRLNMLQGRFIPFGASGPPKITYKLCKKSK